MFPISALSIAIRRRFLSKSISLYKLFSTQSPSIQYPLSHPIYMIWGANTGVGKTLVSAGLAASALSPLSLSSKFIYLKPVQTGFPEDSDSDFVYRKFSEIFHHRRPQFTVFASNHALKASISASQAVLGVDTEEIGKLESGFRDLGWYEERKLQGEGGEAVEIASELICKMIYGWKAAVSPHLAAGRERAVVDDSYLLGMVKQSLGIGCEDGHNVGVFSVLETAGGVASPGPSGSLQCDLYRPFRLPAILVGDGRLGGISSTISAYESLKLRGYDVVAVVFEDHGLVNEVPLLSYLRNRVPVLVLPPIPQDMSDKLMEWFDEAQCAFSSLKEIMISDFIERTERLRDMPKKARDIIWWPFTQHKLVPEETVTVIDSRCGEHFAVHKVLNHDFIMQQFDACASWWTQGPDHTLQIELARDMGYAAARFGHVMFPENIHEPALECAELLLGGVGKGWASRVFFSDNGSTSIEIALKMAFRKFLFDNGILLGLPKADTTERCIDLKVLALRGSYHGDTLGAMEAQAPSSYTGYLQQPWYTGRGLFLDPPTVFMHNGVWKLSLPERMHPEKVNVEDTSFGLRDELFNKSRDGSSLAGCYSLYILKELSLHSGLRGFSHIGALIIEPVVQGSGGMLMVDPLFQRVLVKECRSRKIPVIFDEVFTGFWRLGVESAAELLCCQPDIACFAKLMTGGIVPLAATLATGPVFDAFVGDSKLQALLHGHSYTAHAMGCTAAAKSIKWFKDKKTNFNLIFEGRLLGELWDMDLVKQISFHHTVHRVVALGTLCALELRAEGHNAGYASLYARSLLQNLREDGIYTRPLGNVIYLMCGPCTSPQTCRQLLEILYKRLEEFGQANQV
ncbi:bifunctional dethiobiotin synthetase/7,8-diamino-pelargonic acid aminotransferase, mitochondrial isoform X1 [Actinidia eriantha]|uniref:bifunctional dethiobiotin synthetase/7,8-diamino-pelargonic acid aminotransferase, mitochondrial isoform X1 n=1 Tax=Actinidia eriantha TaxID=165200 RepID=UPI00258D087D|nr:bifunctional dethiobiotin synthetase/7,8-diamino-pelargonic acid aminotransferase, mitochondrial isoform X1 [Actinidia eriantha]